MVNDDGDDDDDDDDWTASCVDGLIWTLHQP